MSAVEIVDKLLKEMRMTASDRLSETEEGKEQTNPPTGEKDGSSISGGYHDTIATALLAGVSVCEKALYTAEGGSLVLHEGRTHCVRP